MDQERLLRKPLHAIRDLFATTDHKHAAQSADDFGEVALITKLLEDHLFVSKIPSLNKDMVELIPNTSLVMFRGMVQDMLNPEYYLGAYQDCAGAWHTTKYADNLEVDEQSIQSTQMWERKPLYCTAVPGESAWVTKTDSKKGSKGCLLGETCGQTGSAKRPRQDADAREDAVQKGAAGCCEEVDKVPSTEDETDAATKMQRLSLEGRSGGAAAPTTPVKAVEGDCLVYVYDSGGDLKLNEVAEFIGVLSTAPELAMVGAAMEDSMGTADSFTFPADELATRLPTSQVPRLHCIVARPEAASPPTSSAALPAKGPAELAVRGAALRQQAVQLLASALGGDQLAAEYLLLQLVSRVYVRGEDDIPLGMPSLNITNCPTPPADATSSAPAATDDSQIQQRVSADDSADKSDAAAAAKLQPPAELTGFARGLLTAVQALVPRCIAIPLTIPEMNRVALVPKRDYASNRLVQAPLQAADGTHVLLDETALQPGQLDNTGIDNVKAIQSLISAKRVEYQFEYYGLPVRAELPVAILSGRPSLFRDITDLALPLQPTAPFCSAEEVVRAASGADLAAVRAYLGAVRQLDFQIGEAGAARLEAELVASRQSDASLDATTFHIWLTLARLLALSYGEQSVSEERWREMRALEQRRTERLRVV